MKNIIDYRLPVTVATFTTTTVKGERPGEPQDGDQTVQLQATKTVSADVVLATSSDLRSSLVAEFRPCWVYDLSASVQLTDDMRLTSASSESTGSIGTVLATAIKVASTAVGLFSVGLAAVEPAPEIPTVVAVPPAFARVTRYRKLITRATEQIVELSDGALPADSTKGPSLDDLRKVRLLESARAGFERELERALRDRDAWIGAQSSSRQSTGVESIPTDRLVETTVVSPDGTIAVPTLPDDVRAVWSRTGTLVTVDEVVVPDKGSDVVPTMTRVTTPFDVKGKRGVWMRLPRTVTWTVWKQAEGEEIGDAIVEVHRVQTGQSLVVDAKSEIRFVKFRRSIWAKRSVKVGFSANGMLNSFETSAGSTLSAIASAADAGLKGVGEGLTAAKDMRTTWAALQDQAANEKLEDLKRKVEQRENELKEAGQEATATDYAELERLKQQQAIVEAQTALSPTGLATAALNRDTELDKAQREANQTIRDLRSELSLLQLDNEIAEQKKKATTG